jgi:hypothetical protein
MNMVNSKLLPAPPNWLKALLAGFDAVSNHMGLLLFPIVLDLLLWFGPQLRLSQLIRAYLDLTLQAAGLQTGQVAEFTRASTELLQPFADRFNLVSTLRTFPIGVASLMTGRGPLENPLGQPLITEITSFGAAFLAWLGLFMVGLLLVTAYFWLVSRAVLPKAETGNSLFGQVVSRFSQVTQFSLFSLAVLVAVAIPLSCILPSLASAGSFGRVGLLIYAVIISWLLFPLIFAPFGIFVHQDNMWASVRRGARLARWTMPNTFLFVLIIMVFSQGLDLLWNIPPDNSWFTLVGIVGHAFIAASLLAAFFIYYRDAGMYVQGRIQQFTSNS